MSILVDSSVWIAGSHSADPICLKLKQMIRKNEPLCVIRPIQVEVCQGVRTEEEFRRLWDGFLGFECLEVTDPLWAKSAWNYFRCRKRGITLTTMDCLIATAAKEYELELWSLDNVFKKVRPMIGFDLY